MHVVTRSLALRVAGLALAVGATLGGAVVAASPAHATPAHRAPRHHHGHRAPNREERQELRLAIAAGGKGCHLEWDGPAYPGYEAICR